MTDSPRYLIASLALLLTILPALVCQAEVSENLLSNPSFEEGVDENGIPVGWALYGGQDENRHINLVDIADTGVSALLIDDDDPGKEIGISQTLAVKPDLVYEASVMVRRIEGATSGGSHLQLRFTPAGEYFQTGLAARSAQSYNRVSVKGVAPPDTTTATIYLYTHRGPKPKVMVDSVSLVSGVEPPPPPPPEPVPPVYDKLKDLHITTELVKDGEANVTIITPASGVYDVLAARIQAAIRDLTGVEVPIASDESPAGAVPIAGNLIALGNRSTNKTIEQLYNFYYCLLDLKYPGPEGHVVRTLHNPFGDGRNVIFAGGSDAVGVEAATDVLIEKLNAAGGKQGALSIGRLMEIQLGKGITVPTDIREFEIWEASRGYGSSGYFGWCSISKRMAMYYMTGDEFSAREALRLSFPDAKAKQDIADIDGERIENKDDPLAGFYHYNAHMAILFWDLIEESPVFTEEERLKVTNAFSRQLNHRKNEGPYRMTQPPRYVSSRHGQWSAVSLYCLGRYFQKDYPNPIWAQCVRGGQLAFHSLHEHAWVSGESDNLFWYNTGIAPIFTHMALTGDRKPLEAGVIARLLRGQEMLISGLVPDWALNSASMGFLNKAAYFTGDGRWVTYRERTGVDTDILRLGQSFWPADDIEPQLPTDLVDRWTIHYLPEPAWAARGTGFEPEESFYFGSYRNTVDDSGDFILVDGFNGASRNPYHTFAILELRLAGYTLLKGYRNQVLTKADGMVEPAVAMNAALKHSDVLGGAATIVADVPSAAFCDWQRTLTQRTGKYALIVDDLTFRADSENMEVQTLWEARGGRWKGDENALQMRATGGAALPAGWIRARALASEYTSDPAGPDDIVKLDSINIVLLRAKEVGAWLEMAFELPEKTSGEVFAELVNYVDRGKVRIYLDGKPVVEEYDHWAPSAVTQRVPLGPQELAAGAHRLRVEAIEKHEGNDRCYVGLGGVVIRPEGAAAADAAVVFELRPGDLMPTQSSGSVFTMQWRGAVKENERRRFFSLIGMSPGDGDSPLACVRVADNAAALALPQPALAVVGEHRHIKADLAILAEDHLHGLRLESAGLDEPLIRADKPLDIDWDFVKGELHLVAYAELTNVALAGADIDPDMRVDGQRLGVPRLTLGKLDLSVPPGKHVIKGVKPSTQREVSQNLAKGLQAALAQAREKRAALVAAAEAAPEPTAPPLTTPLAVSVGESVTDLITIPSEGGPLLCAAEGKTVHIIAQDGSEIRSLEADAAIRVLHWWPEHKLLLVGCVDEQVIAFDEAGDRKWVFTSVMDPAVFRAAKTYWFKTAPGHEGIHGLSAGDFIDGKSQAFVGSACTLEIIDESGKLVKRLPVFWGPGWKFNLISGPDDTKNLLIARWPNGNDTLAMVNSKTLSVGRGFYSVPGGHTHVGGWAGMNRTRTFYDDLDGAGAKEVVSAINGVWNRVTVWSEDGKALYNAQFGPGVNTPYANMRDLDIADLDGDGKKELITATGGGLVVALDCQCNRLWSKQLPSPPRVLKALTPKGAGAPWIVVGCDDGTVVALDGQGELVRLDKIEGRPTRILELDTQAAGPVVVLASSEGEIKAFAP